MLEYFWIYKEPWREMKLKKICAYNSLQTGEGKTFGNYHLLPFHLAWEMSLPRT